jgi:protein required for attachment to host cells
MSDIKLKNGGWIVVADGSKALFLKNSGDATLPVLDVFREEAQENPATRDQGTSRPGRMRDSTGPHNSAMETTDWHQLAEDRFAKDLADILYRQAHRGEFKELIIVAAPAVLGEMRKELHKEVSDRVIAEIAKDYTNHPVDQIGKLVLAGG